MSRVLIIATFLAALLQPAVGLAQEASIEAFFEDPGVLPTAEMSHRVLRSRPLTSRGTLRPDRMFATPYVRRDLMVSAPSMIRRLFEWITGAVRLSAASRRRDENPSITVGCIANAQYSGSDISVDVTLTVSGPSGSDGRVNYFSASAGEALGEVFTMEIPSSTDAYFADCSARFSFACCSQFVDVSSQAQAPPTLTMPSGEFTGAQGWDGPNDTVTKFQATLEPSIVIFGGRFIKESTGPGGVTDFCHFPDSECEAAGNIPFMQALQLPSGQSHYLDFVGWPPFCVGHYRTNGRAPCDSSTDQSVSINTRGGSAEPSAVYVNNMLRSGITNTTVWNSRAGIQIERIWP